MVQATLVTGLAGGVVATTVMTVFTMALGDDSPPPTAALWAKYVGDGPPADYTMPGMALHMLYGLGAGVAFALAVPLLGLTVTLPTAVGLGIAYGLGLTVVGAVLWMRVVLGMEPEPPQVAMFTFFHLVYGVVLGAVVGVL